SAPHGPAGARRVLRGVGALPPIALHHPLALPRPRRAPGVGEGRPGGRVGPLGGLDGGDVAGRSGNDVSPAGGGGIRDGEESLRWEEEPAGRRFLRLRVYRG